jgi:hypothetical protein
VGVRLPRLVDSHHQRTGPSLLTEARGLVWVKSIGKGVTGGRVVGELFHCNSTHIVSVMGDEWWQLLSSLRRPNLPEWIRKIWLQSRLSCVRELNGIYWDRFHTAISCDNLPYRHNTQ